ncbi:MAG: site-2 protease family protein [Acidobacteriota bacterium]
MMFKNSFYIGKIAGIPIRIHISWLIVFVLFTWHLAGNYFPQNYPGWDNTRYLWTGVITSLLFFVSVLIHELAHSIVATKQELPVRDIVLFIFGGVSELTDEPKSAGNEFLMALVGPLSSFLLAILFGILWLIMRELSEPVSAIGGFLASINLMLAIFNMIPGFPLDGGRVFRAILWGIKGNLVKATRWASAMGQGFAMLLIFLGIWQLFKGNWVNGMWFSFIGWFLDNAALSSYRQVTAQQTLIGHIVREAMTRDCPQLSPDMTIERVVEEYILGLGKRCLPVVQDKRLLGLVTIHSIKKIPKEQWSHAQVHNAMIPLEKIRSVKPDESLLKVLHAMTEDGVNQLAVIDGEEFVGLLARDNVVSFIRNRLDLGL